MTENQSREPAPDEASQPPAAPPEHLAADAAAPVEQVAAAAAPAGPSDAASASPPPSPPSTPPPSPEELKAAFKAFKKRLKLTQLDDASRIGRSPMSSGGNSSIAGITPPNQYPRAVWEELANQGKLRRAGHGTYSLA